MTCSVGLLTDAIDTCSYVIFSILESTVVPMLRFVLDTDPVVV